MALAIPKIIHRVWVGNTLPDETFWLEWQRLHPSWKCITHHYPDNNKMPLTAQANIIRATVLNNYGGFYVDHDLEPFDTIESLRNHILCAPKVTGKKFSICFFGSVPNKLNYLVDHLNNIKEWQEDYNITEMSGSALWNKILDGKVDIIKPGLIDAMAGRRRSPTKATLAAHWGKQQWK